MAWFGAIALFCLLVAGWTAWHGNVFAPAFALLDIGVLAFAFAAMWRSGQRAEWIELSPQAIVVRRVDRGVTSVAGQFHPGWVRLVQVMRRAPSDTCLLLRSHGRSLEIGAFLAEEERKALAVTLRRALEELKAGAGPTGMG